VRRFGRGRHLFVQCARARKVALTAVEVGRAAGESTHLRTVVPT
jgi:hypothetical protein